MNKLHITLLLFSTVLFSCSDPVVSGPAREQRSLDHHWRFYPGDVSDAHQKDFDDSTWRMLDLPHDWSIEGAYDKNNPAGIAGAFLPTGIGWYRKAIDYQPEWDNRRVAILFDGVYMNSTVYINGKVLGTRPYGYIGFQYDLTDYLVPGKNVIAVKVDHSKAPSGRWYTGSGIYRHVNLLVTGQLHLSRHGVQVQSELERLDLATVRITSTLENHSSGPGSVVLHQILRDKEGRVVHEQRSEKTAIDREEVVDQQFTLEDPLLWSAESPENRYVLETRVLDGRENVIDEVSNVIGFRKIEVSAEKGLLVNGKKTIIKGMCMHHDAGPVGAAVPEDVLRRRLELLKQMGCNAIRTTHNPFAPEFYRMCDEMGFYVMDEAFDGWEVAKAEHDYGNYFEEWWQQDLTEFIKRDMNHPSVIFWSIGNEVRGFTDKRQHELVGFIERLDPTRPVTQGEGSEGTAIGIAGMNGHGEMKGAIADFHRKHPGKPIIGTEITHTYQTRGVYRTRTSYRRRDFPAPWEQGQSFDGLKDKIYLIPDLSEKEVFPESGLPYQSSYDNSIVRMGIRDYWRETKDKPYFLGAFRWTAFDYLGESFGWPARTAPFGIMDLCGFPTDNYYLYQSIWSDKPMVHLLPHWTHPGKENVKIPVVVYTNTGGAELFLNGKSLGRKMLKEDELQLVWQVPYQPGELKVVARTDAGKEITKSYKTAGTPAAVKISTDRTGLSYKEGDVAHLEITIVDDKGTEVPQANRKLHIEVSGGGRCLGLENGDILDHTPHQSPYRKTFNGKLLALVGADDTAQDIGITVSGEGLAPARLTLEKLD
ncbi:glycoside hydrolase family 2 TIM barrel-domain containing protein [Sinomicrobium soli]|uniref:glycoside hydrolase family 2 TIM barrel-domain containing protein n=1 Tax=Sinomicrobium sp. N-1-3-6 TaxID=2219864 RepID=UPI000DCE3B84|nr:glycoside hydrolase family 2 TIM barrel-domain containing protein [Sinomicrobium sp. N-1-3-6]RAV28479.1 glycoside hydrolase family 2 [Sinomicrobium sp. N-1-3-6]